MTVIVFINKKYVLICPKTFKTSRIPMIHVLFTIKLNVGYATGHCVHVEITVKSNAGHSPITSTRGQEHIYVVASLKPQFVLLV